MSRLRKVLKEADEVYGELKSSDWWSPQDDYLLIQAVERGYDAKTIHETVKFSVPFSKKEISNRWKELLYDEEVTRNVLPFIIKVSNVTSQRIPWTKGEDKIIKKELKEKGFLSFAHILHLNRKEFHCSRTVGSMESHYWSLKKRGKLDKYKMKKQKRGSRRTTIDYSPEKNKKKKKKTKRKVEESEEAFVFQGLKAGKTGKKKGTSRRNSSRRLSKAGSIKDMNKPPPKLAEIPSMAFAYLDGMNCRIFIEKKESLVGKKTKVITPDLDLSLEGNASRLVGKQAYLRFCREQNGAGGVNYFFAITNQSKKPLFVGDEKVAKDCTTRVNHGEILSFPGTRIKLKLCQIHERMEIAKGLFFKASTIQSDFSKFMNAPGPSRRIPHLPPNITGNMNMPGLPSTAHPNAKQGGKVGPGQSGNIGPIGQMPSNNGLPPHVNQISGVSVTPNMVVPKPPDP